MHTTRWHTDCITMHAVTEKHRLGVLIKKTNRPTNRYSKIVIKVLIIVTMQQWHAPWRIMTSLRMFENIPCQGKPTKNVLWQVRPIHMSTCHHGCNRNMWQVFTVLQKALSCTCKHQCMHVLTTPKGLFNSSLTSSSYVTSLTYCAYMTNGYYHNTFEAWIWTRNHTVGASAQTWGQ